MTSVLVTVLVLVFAPLSVYFSVKLGTYGHYRARFLYERNARHGNDEAA
jgi:hypothetical protein